jgi:Rrf2 family protein
MLSQSVEYALRAVYYLATVSPETRTTEEIHAATRIKKAYLAKILQELSRKRIVQTLRGVGGGVALAKSPDSITILDVVNAMEPIRRINSCPLDLANHGRHLCPLHKRMDEGLARLEETYSRSTLAEILALPKGAVLACETLQPPCVLEPRRSS